MAQLVRRTSISICRQVIMKMSRILVDGVLCIILAFGLFGAAKVSYDNFTGTACPYGRLYSDLLCRISRIRVDVWRTGDKAESLQALFFQYRLGNCFCYCAAGFAGRVFFRWRCLPVDGKLGNPRSIHGHTDVLHLDGSVDRCLGAVSARLLQTRLRAM